MEETLISTFLNENTPWMNFLPWVERVYHKSECCNITHIQKKQIRAWFCTSPLSKQPLSREKKKKND